jgi:hypothetical protein
LPEGRLFCLFVLNTRFISTAYLYRILQWAIAAIWFVNGFICKVLNLVPRHRQIVGRILGERWAAPATLLIGMLEVLMAVWILSQLKPKWCALCQAVLILTMNVMEFFLVPDLLLFGHGNAVWAGLLILVILGNEFYLKQASYKTKLAN